MVHETRAATGRAIAAALGYVALLLASHLLSVRLGVDGRLLMALATVVLLSGLCLGSAGAREFLRTQATRARSGWIEVLCWALAGVAFHLAYFAVSGVDASRISGWRLDARFLASAILLSSIAAPFVEEVFFRLFAIWRSRRFPALLAVAISGAAFALLHPERPVSVLVFAALAAIAYLRVGIAASLAFHVAYNLGNYLLLLAASQANGA